MHTHQWLTLTSAWRSAPSWDSAWPEPDDGDVALFAGVARPSTGTDDRDVDLLLCGSVNHFRHRVATGSHMGSDTRWLHDFIQEVENRDQHGVRVPPRSPPTSCRRERIRTAWWTSPEAP